MATHDYIISNASGAAVRADLNNALAAIATNNSSATEPTTTYAYQWWADTGSSPTVMKLRNAANSGWVTLFQLDGEWSLIPFENGTAAAPSIYFKDSGTDTGFYSPGVDQVGITTGGVARLTTSTTAVTSTLPVVYPLGAVGTPSITFTGDLNTGIWSPAADTIAASTGGTERLRITSAGSVGINTASPNLTGFTGRVATLNLPAATNGGFEIAKDGNLVAVFAVEAGTNDVRFGTTSSAATALWANNQERARIDSSGRLLVGTSSSRGTISASFPSLVQVETSVYAAYQAINNTNDANGAWLALGKSRGASAGGVTVVQNNDELGFIGFLGADGTDVNSIAAAITAQVDGTPGNNDMPGRLVFSTTADGASSPTERMRITNAGYLKISNSGSYTNASGTFHELIQTENGYGIEIYNKNASLSTSVLQVSADRNTTNSTYNLIRASRIGATDCFFVRDSGNVQNTNNSYTGTSDAKLKENIVDATSQWDDIKSLKVRKFNFKEETGNSTHTQIGLIAQEVELVSPGLVNESPDRDVEGNDLGTVTKSVNYSVLYMKAVKALQEAMERIEQLEAKVAALESA